MALVAARDARLAALTTRLAALAQADGEADDRADGEADGVADGVADGLGFRSSEGLRSEAREVVAKALATERRRRAVEVKIFCFFAVFP